MSARPSTFALFTACALSACAFSACSKTAPPAAQSETSAGATTASAPAASAPTASASPAKAKQPDPPRKSAPKPLTRSEAEALAVYRAAMSEGRKASRDKKLPEAIAAFDRALAAVPDDARAYGERGYARILAKDFKAAIPDLDRAAARTEDRKLLATVWFNYGLAAEGTGDAERARAAFARSNALNATKAAANKLAGKSACPATLESAAADGETLADWKSAYESVRASDDALPAWSGDASLRALCGDAYRTGEPCLQEAPGVVSSATLWLADAGGKIHRHELGIAGGRCGGAVDAKVVGAKDGVVRVQVRVDQGLVVSVMEKDGEMVPCEGDNPCSTACAEPGVSYTDVFFDAATGRRLLAVVREALGGGTADPLRVSRAGRAVTLKGAGCDRTVTLP